MWMGAFSVLCFVIHFIIVSDDQVMDEMYQLNSTCEDDFLVRVRKLRQSFYIIFRKQQAVAS